VSETNQLERLVGRSVNQTEERMKYEGVTFDEFAAFFGVSPRRDNRSIDWRGYGCQFADNPPETCRECALCSYGRDCHNNPAAEDAQPKDQL